MCEKFDSITAVVPARINSTRVEAKVFQKIDTQYGFISLLEYKLLELKKVFKNIILSCGEPEIAEIGHRLEVSVSHRERRFIERKYKVSTQESIREVIKDVHSDHVAWCPPVVPFHTAYVIRNAVSKYFELDNRFDSLATVQEDRGYYWFKGAPLNYFCDYRHVQSQQLEPLIKISNGIYVCKTVDILRRGYFLGDNPYLLPVNKINCIDIDDMDDLDIARALAASLSQNFLTE